MRGAQPNPVGATPPMLVPGFAGTGVLLLAYAGLGLGTWWESGHWVLPEDVLALGKGELAWTWRYTAALSAVGILATAVIIAVTYRVVRGQPEGTERRRKGPGDGPVQRAVQGGRREAVHRRPDVPRG